MKDPSPRARKLWADLWSVAANEKGWEIVQAALTAEKEEAQREIECPGCRETRIDRKEAAAHARLLARVDEVCGPLHLGPLDTEPEPRNDDWGV